jgi:Zn-dependent peptidase ImmA (M78 family)
MTVQVYGDRVRTARVLRGIKAVDLAHELGWPPSRQTLIEQSEVVHLDVSSVAMLVDQLGFPEAFFTTQPAPVLAPRDLLFRAPKSITKRETSYLTEFARVTGEVLVWLDSYHRLPPVSLPSLPSETPIPEAAAQARDAMGLPRNHPISNLTFRLERAGVPVVARSPEWGGLPEKHVGYSTRVGDHREQPLTILRAQKSWERTRWTIAHEVAHHVLHGTDMPGNAEDQANRFASELLAPADVIRHELPPLITLASLTDLKLRWGISLGALILHLSWNDLINDERTQMLRKQLYTRINSGTGHTWGRDEPGASARTPEQPSLITTWMQRCLGGTSPNFISTLSGVWPADLIAAITGSQQKTAQMTSRGPQRTPAKETGTEVIDLDTWRLRALS